MAMLKSYSCHQKSTKVIMRKLEGDDGERVLGFFCVNLGSPSDVWDDWARLMDSTRTFAENHTDWGSRRCVTYQHYVISPEPSDEVDIETLHRLTVRWVYELFGTDMDPGYFGQYEVAVIYHDDNERSIPHAHIIVNNTNLVDGKRLQVNKKDSKLMANRLQEMCKEMGLTYFDEDGISKREDPVGDQDSFDEDEMVMPYIFTWRDDIEMKVGLCKWVATCEGDFVNRCARDKIDVIELEDGDYLYACSRNPGKYSVSGHELGEGYTRANVLAEIDARARSFASRDKGGE